MCVCDIHVHVCMLVCDIHMHVYMLLCIHLKSQLCVWFKTIAMCPRYMFHVFCSSEICTQWFLFLGTFVISNTIILALICYLVVESSPVSSTKITTWNIVESCVCKDRDFSMSTPVSSTNTITCKWIIVENGF